MFEKSKVTLVSFIKKVLFIIYKAKSGLITGFTLSIVYTLLYNHIVTVPTFSEQISLIIVCILMIGISTLVSYNSNTLQARSKGHYIIPPPDIDNMNGIDFEHFCAELLKHSGFKHIKVTKASGDQGVDIIAFKHNKKYAFQCKRSSKNVGNKAIQEVNAGRTYHKATIAVVLTNQFYTKSARDLASITDVCLWGRDTLEDLLKTAGYGGLQSETYSNFNAPHKSNSNTHTKVGVYAKTPKKKQKKSGLTTLLLIVFTGGLYLIWIVLKELVKRS